MAVAAAVINGFSIYVNSLGVGGVIKDATLYTTLKNAVVGVIVLVPVLLLAGERRQFAHLSGRQRRRAGSSTTATASTRRG